MIWGAGVVVVYVLCAARLQYTVKGKVFHGCHGRGTARDGRRVQRYRLVGGDVAPAFAVAGEDFGVEGPCYHRGDEFGV